MYDLEITGSSDICNFPTNSDKQIKREIQNW